MPQTDCNAYRLTIVVKNIYYIGLILDEYSFMQRVVHPSFEQVKYVVGR